MLTEDPYYLVVPGIDVVHLDGGDVVLHSGTVTLRLEGESANLLTQDVFPLLDGARPLSDVVERVRVDADDLRLHLDSLVDRGILRSAERPLDTQDARDSLAPFLGLLDELGLTAADARERLATLTVAVVGLEAHGAHVAWNLARVGVGELMLADPYPCEPENLALIPEAGDDAVGAPRQDVLLASLPTERGTRVTTVDGTELTRDHVQELASRAHVVIGCFDKAFSAANVWINEAVLACGNIGLFGRFEAHLATLGPLVLPGRSACYLCWRMRELACAAGFEEAMAYEESLDRRRSAALHTRKALPFLSEYAGSILATQALIAALGLSVPPLVNSVFEFNGLTLESEKHAVLQKPDCPACRKKAPASSRAWTS